MGASCTRTPAAIVGGIARRSRRESSLADGAVRQLCRSRAANPVGANIKLQLQATRDLG